VVASRLMKVNTTRCQQVGGLMRSEEMFKRAVVRYSINGSIESITEEVCRPCITAEACRLTWCDAGQ